MRHTPLDAAALDELQQLLDRVPAPLEPLDASMLDGFLCGVLVQPAPVPLAQWLAHVTDTEGRALPHGFAAVRLHALVQQRHGELDRAIQDREWFDPWVFEMAPDEAQGPGLEPSDTNRDAVYPWVAGFALAMNAFPALMQRPAEALTEPLALLYRHLDPDDLEDADQLLDAIESLAPPADLSETVQDLVRATFLLADVGRPLAPKSAPRRPASAVAARRGRPTRR